MTDVNQGGQPTPAPAPGTPEHDLAMIAKFDATLPEDQREKAAAPAKPERPADVPEQFWDAEKGVVDYVKMAKSYSDAQRKITELSQQRREAPPAQPQPSAAEQAHAAKAKELNDVLTAVKAKQGVTPEEITAAEKALTDHNQAKPAPQAAKSDENLFADFASEFNKSGKISDEFYQRFEKSGISREMLDNHVAGQLALSERRNNGILKGAELTADEFSKIAAWSKSVMTPEQIAAFDNLLSTGKVEEASLALQNLKAKYVAANGNDPTLLGGKPGVSGVAGYQNLDEYKAAMRDPRYSKDESYRNSVYQKLNATTAF